MQVRYCKDFVDETPDDQFTGWTCYVQYCTFCAWLTKSLRKAILSPSSRCNTALKGYIIMLSIVYTCRLYIISNHEFYLIHHRSRVISLSFFLPRWRKLHYRGNDSIWRKEIVSYETYDACWRICGVFEECLFFFLFTLNIEIAASYMALSAIWKISRMISPMVNWESVHNCVIKRAKESSVS